MLFLEVVQGDEVYERLYFSLDKEITKIEQYPSSRTTLKTASIVLTTFQGDLVQKTEVYQKGVYGANPAIFTLLKARVPKAANWVKAVGLCVTLFILFRFITPILYIVALACTFSFFIPCSNRVFVTFKHLFEYYDSNYKEGCYVNLSIRESIKESIYEASQNIADAYIKKKGCDSILARANLEVIISGKLIQYNTEDIEIIS